MSEVKNILLFNKRGRFRFWKKITKQSLTVKLIIAVGLLFCLMIGIGTIAVISISRKAIAETSITAALYQTQIIKGKLINIMLNEQPRHEEIEVLIEREKRFSSLNEINIFNFRGEIRFSSAPENIGQSIDTPFSETDNFLSEDARVELIRADKVDRLRILSPIQASPQCMTCHVGIQTGQFIGGMELFMPLRPIYQQFTANRILFICIALGIMTLGAVLIQWIVRKIVKQPIRKLIGVMKEVEKGKLEVRTKIHVDPDLSSLAKGFNKMVRGVQSAQKRIERQYQKELAQSNRLASLGQLISNISHEVKNPLAAISSALHALQDEFKTVEGKEIFSEITGQTKRIEQTVNNLLRYARQASPHFEYIDITASVTEALHFSKHHFMKNRIQTHLNCKTKPPKIWGDSGQLQQVFLNLFLNAARAMPGGGVLNITIQSVGLVKNRHLISPIPGEGLVVEIEDTGSGIKKENLSKVFEPFFSTAKDGTGLGLSVVKGIIEAHKGKINIKSAEEKGTNIILFFPFLSHNKAES